MSRYYLSVVGSKMVEQMEMSEQLTSNYAGLGAAMAAEVMIDFWYGLELSSPLM